MNQNDYDEDGNNVVLCPICLSEYCVSKEGGKCLEQDEYIKWLEERKNIKLDNNSKKEIK